MKILVAVMLAAGLAISIDTATRTPIILCIAVYVVMFLIHLFNKRGTKALKTLLLMVILVSVVFVAYQSNLVGLQSALHRTPLFQRLLNDGFSTSRWEIAQKYFALMLEYPWGGKHIERAVGSLAHNYLQECYDLYGLFAFTLLLIICAQFASNCLKLIGKRQKTETDMLFLALYISILLQMCVEPVFTGYPLLIWSLLLIHGMATAYLKTHRNTGYCIT